MVQTPRHPRARFFQQNGLFQDIRSFTQLEERIAALPDPDNRRAAFELFVEGFLAVSGLLSIREIRPGRPADLDDPRPDGVLQASWGDLLAYRALFLEARRPLKKDELLFFSRPPGPFRNRLLISNATDLPAGLDAHGDFMAIGAHDLDHWRPAPFADLRRWVQGGGLPGHVPPPPPPWIDHLARDTRAALRDGEMLPVLLPGGSGRAAFLRHLLTLDGGRTAILVVPHAARLAELLRAWREAAPGTGLATLAVSRDAPPARRHDLPGTRATQRDFLLTVDPDAVRRFWNWRYFGARVILVTPGTLDWLAQALTGLPPADLLILDDGPLGRKLPPTPGPLARAGVVLTPALRRLEGRKRDAQGEATVLFQTARTVLPDATEPGSVPILLSGAGEPGALWPPLRRAMAATRARRLLAFLPDPEAAMHLALSNRDPGLSCFALSGTQSPAQRARLREDYQQAPGPALLANARCLLHDGPLPPADLVFFEPAGDKGDWETMVALWGRLRETPGENPPWLVLPLPPPDDQGHWWRVLEMLGEALQGVVDGDRSLARRLRRMRMDLGARGAWDDTLLTARVRAIGPLFMSPGRRQGLNETLVYHLTTPWDQGLGTLAAWVARRGAADPPPDAEGGLGQWVEAQREAWRKGRLAPERQRRLEKLGLVWDPEARAWEQALQRFEAYRRATGHGLVPEDWAEDADLAQWASAQRKLALRGRLAPERRERLTALGFVWDLEQAHWQVMVRCLERFRAGQGHGSVPDAWPEDPGLADWAAATRLQHRRGRLTPARVAELTVLGFDWDPEQTRWEAMLAQLARSLPRAGDFPATWPGQPALADWLETQRHEWRRNRLAPERRRRLDELGMVWDLEARAWEEQRRSLVAFRERHGHAHVPREGDDPPGLGAWLAEQRRQQRKGRLAPERQAALEALEVLWDETAADWERNCRALADFQSRRSHCFVPRDWPEDPALPRWVETQRRLWSRQELSPERIQRLETLGFVWDTREVLWEQMFAELAQFREDNGHCNVPDPHDPNPDLAWWVSAQRKARANGNLNPRWQSRLEAIGFVWDPQEVQWREMLEMLAVFRRRYGHCLVPKDWPENSRLGNWVAIQRNAREKGLLVAERVQALDALGFIWDKRLVIQEEMFMALAAFRQRHGHCNVPLEWPENPPLALWVLSQRQQRRQGRLDEERVRRLETLGFAWQE
ncbi:MAG: helicase associated domain-containing protein [Magnetococcales bacterium]|nr:helicase associated domain-containing protein [Magnetococcales bacterium]